MKHFNKIVSPLLLLLVLLSSFACAQSNDKIPRSKNVPQFRVETVATGLEVVWSIVFAPDGRMFFTERPGRVRVFENGRLREKPLFVVPDVEPSGRKRFNGHGITPELF
jgi:glucose/arabinose dehydrogenase